MEQPFVHLHVHTEYSLLDGLSKINKLVARAQELEMQSLAITDHGTMFGVMQFYRACKEASIKPIIGVESYLARKDRFIQDTSERQPFHLLLLAKNATGYKNLLKLSSEAQLTGFYGKPRIDKDLLSQYSEGLICTSGCLAAEIPRAFGDGREAHALEMIGTYQDIFGKDNFFLELQHHDIPEIHKLNDWLVRYRGKADVPLVATNDVHYVLDGDFNAHDTLLCIQTGALKADAKRMRMTDPSYHLRTPAEMWALFGDAAPEALTNTLLIADMCDLNLDDKTYHLPVFPVPEGYTAASYLQALTMRGARWRWGEDAEKHQERLDYELSIINRMGFDTYFLIVWDLCEFARKADIWWNVRGSGAGSAVAYCLGITSIDPIRNNLIFERFLNPGRVSMPDIDMDFPDDRRSEMIDYAKRKYGEDKVAGIITFNTLKARAAIKDVGRVLNYPLAEVSKLTQMIPQIPSHPVTLAQCLSDDPDYALPDLKKLYAEDEQIKTLLDTALTVEGMSRNAGTHAAGIIIGDKPLVEYLPLHRPTSNNVEIAINRVTQFPMEICESIGLLKVDFLGLSTLTIMRKACELIERYYGIQYDMSNIPYRPDPNDPEQSRMVEAAFKLISSGEVTGVFQLEGQGMRKMLADMKPKTFEHIIAAISLYRPGPMQFIPTYIKRMHGEEEVEYLHPKLESILSETYSVITYQEQIQRIGAELFGYSLGDADLMRRAVSKKKAKDLAKHKEIFKEKGPSYGVSVEVAEKVFEQVAYFAAYGFNKSHAADYAILTCQTAFLKAHYPSEFYTAMLSVQRDRIDDVTLFTSDCRRLGIPILPPSVNHSEQDFTIEETDEGRAIRFGLGAIKGVGDKATATIAEERIANGPFASLIDFARRIDIRQAGKHILEPLIKAGAFDMFGERDKLIAAADRIYTYSQKHHNDLGVGQASMFGAEETSDEETFFSQLGDYKRFSQRDMLRWEKELMGLYVSDHPLNVWSEAMQNIPNMVLSGQLKAEGEVYHDHAVTVAGLAVGTRQITTKKNEAMAIVSLEDAQGNVEAVFFPRTWARYHDMIEDDKIYIVRGRADTSREGVTPQIIVDSVSQDFEIAEADDRAPAPPPVITTTSATDETAMPDSHDVDEPADDGLPDSLFEGTPAEPPEEDTSFEPLYTPLRRQSNQANDTGSPHTTPPEPPAAMMARTLYNLDEPDTPPARHIIVTLPPLTEVDAERKKWNKRAKRIWGQLIQCPGRDLLTFCFDEGDLTHTVSYPNKLISYEGVRHILDKDFPADAVQIELLQAE